MRRLLLTMLLLCMAGTVQARTTEGTLDLIQLPNEGRPAIVVPGETFDVALQEDATLSLISGATSYPLAKAPVEFHSGLYRCTVPADVPDGVYTLLATSPNRTDSVSRAVVVKAAPPETYRVAHVSNPTVEDDADGGLDGLVRAVNAADVDLVLVTGSLTRDGTAPQFRAVLAFLGQFNAPTFVSPGERDARENRYAAYFGDAVYAFWYGQDGYLGFDTSGAIPVDPLGNDVGRLYLARRAIRPARWSIGFTERYVPRMTMRAQLELFVDDPLDYLVCGAYTPLGADEKTLLPWKETQALPAPTLFDGHLHVFQVTPRQVEAVVPLEPGAAHPAVETGQSVVPDAATAPPPAVSAPR